MRDLVYPATFQPESHGAFTVRFPDFRKLSQAVETMRML
jgi:hypothetical protein